MYEVDEETPWAYHTRPYFDCCLAYLVQYSVLIVQYLVACTSTVPRRIWASIRVLASAYHTQENHIMSATCCRPNLHHTSMIERVDIGNWRFCSILLINTDGYRRHTRLDTEDIEGKACLVMLRRQGQAAGAKTSNSTLSHSSGTCDLRRDRAGRCWHEYVQTHHV